MKKSFLLISALLLLLSCSSDKSKNHENNDLDGVTDSDFSSDIEVISDNDNNISDDDIIADLDETEDSDNIEDADIIEEADDFEEPLPDIDDNYEGIFADPELEKCIERHLPEGEIISEEVLASITDVYCDMEEVRDIRGIEKLINLHKLYLTSYQNIKDYRPLARLKNLKILELSYYDKAPLDLKTLIGPESLEELSVRNSSLESFDNAGYFPNLTRLALAFNELKEVPKDLDKLPKLETVGIGGNKITSYEPLKKLSGAKNLSVLTVAENPASGLSPLSSLKHLPIKVLYVSGGDSYNKVISDLSPVAEFESLELLVAQDNIITKIPENKWVNLKQLRLSFNKLSDISNIVSCKNLEKLQLSSNLLKDVSALSSLPKLRFVWLDSNLIDTIPKSFENLPGLSYLSVVGNNLRDIKNAAYFDKLEYFYDFYISYNFITDISPLKNLKYLSKVELDKNCIKDFSPIADMIERGIVSGVDTQKESCEQPIFLQEVF